MNIFSKQAARRPVFTGLLILLLCLAAALLCDGYAAWIGAGAQDSGISGEYTTIAIPVGVTMDGSDMAALDAFTLAMQRRTLADLAAQEATQVAAIDRRVMLGAWLPNQKGLSSCSVDPAEYNIAFEDESNSLAVLALRCVSVTPRVAEDEYDAAFQLEEAVCLMDAYSCFPSPEEIHIRSDLCGKNGEIPFKKGKTYLVFGQFHDFRVVKRDTPEGYSQLTAREQRLLVPFPEIGSNASQEPSSLVSSGTYRCAADGCLPWYAQYEGSVKTFLSSDAGSVWAQQVIPLCEKNHQSATVLLTDRVTSLYTFNTGETSLLSGRFFLEQEYADGADVCLVSAAFADLNGLRLGDQVQMDLYKTKFRECSNGALANSLMADRDPGPFWQRFYLRPEDRLDICKDYTIVGIYTGARYAFGAHNFNADTILVPKASVPNAQEYETPSNSRMNTFILQNGAAEAFEEYMRGRDLAGQFLYFDQGFQAVQESLAVLRSNALRLLLVGLGVFALTAALFLFLTFRAMLPTVRGVRRIGCSAGTVWRELMVTLAAVEAIAILLGGVLAAALYKTVTRELLDAAVTLQPKAIAVLAGGALCALLGLSALCALAAVRKKLMQAK